MAAPTYSEDLTDIDLFEAASTGVTTINFSGGGGAATAFGADLGMQGAGCWDRQVSTHERGVVINKTPGAGTVAAGVHIYQWMFVATPGITDTFATRGAFIVAGTSVTAAVQFIVDGSDTYGAAGRVGKCYPYAYVTSAQTGNGPKRAVTGTPGATPTYFGGGIKTIAAAKGANLGVDATRYGTGAYITNGDPTDPGTFAGFNTQNDTINNRWGILTFVSGSYELQGRFVIGQDNTQTPAYAYFEDSDVAITIAETLHAEADFSGFIFDSAGSPKTEIHWTNVNILSLKSDGVNGIVNPGFIEVTANDPIVEFVGGTFTEIGTTTLQLSTTATGTTWRGTNYILCNGATLTSCTFDSIEPLGGSPFNNGAVITDNLDDITLCEFLSRRGAGSPNTAVGDGHAVELTSLGGGSMGWNNTDSRYAATDGSTGNETIFVNVSSGVLTINVAAGASTPTIRTAGAVVTVVAGSVTTTITVLDSAGDPIENARVLVETSNGTGPYPFEESVTITQSGGSPGLAVVEHAGHGLVTGNYVVIAGAVPNGYNGVHQITLNTGSPATGYTYHVENTLSSPATGTPVSSAAFISGLTNASGVISDSRTFGSNQPIKGTVRKSTSSPYYKPGTITGEINSGTGFSATVQLVSDE